MPEIEPLFDGYDGMSGRGAQLVASLDALAAALQSAGPLTAAETVHLEAARVLAEAIARGSAKGRSIAADVIALQGLLARLDPATVSEAPGQDAEPRSALPRNVVDLVEALKVNAQH